MTISRRSFLSGVAPVIAVAAAGQIKASPANHDASELREDVFRAMIGSTFDVHDGSRKRGTVSLIEVNSLDKEKNRTRHAFAVRFQGARLGQGTYRFSCGRRAFDLFIVPSARSAKPTMTAIINRV